MVGLLEDESEKLELLVFGRRLRLFSALNRAASEGCRAEALLFELASENSSFFESLSDDDVARSESSPNVTILCKTAASKYFRRSYLSRINLMKQNNQGEDADENTVSVEFICKRFKCK